MNAKQDIREHALSGEFLRPPESPRASRLLMKLAAKLWADPQKQREFVASILGQACQTPAVVWLRQCEEMHVSSAPRAVWQPDFVDRVSPQSRPGSHPLHAQGAYYVLDLSSVFEAVPVLSSEIQNPSAVIDVCASPGGKSILIWRGIKPSFLLCNEVIRKRCAALISNLERCQISFSAVTCADSKHLANVCPQTAEIVVVDAPCSGQSLIARGQKSPGCFHPATINLNANRQKRIVANSAKLVAPGGYLSYMTCTYSREENEGVTEWFVKKFPEFEPVEVALLQEYRSHLSSVPCYRLWPQQGHGAGGFTVLFKKSDAGRRAERFDVSALRTLWAR